MELVELDCLMDSMAVGSKDSMALDSMAVGSMGAMKVDVLLLKF
jgi:hypothetical protein